MASGIKILVPPSSESSGIGISYNEVASEVFVSTECHPRSQLDDELRCSSCGHSYLNEVNEEKKSRFVRYWNPEYINSEQAAVWVAVWMEVDQSDVYVRIDKA